MNIFAGYDPSTQRKDKFGINLKVTKKELRKLAKKPFFSLYTQKYGSKVMLPTLVMSKLMCVFMGDMISNQLPYVSRPKQNRLFGKSATRAMTLAFMGRASYVRKLDDSFELGVRVFDLPLDQVEQFLPVAVYQLPQRAYNKDDPEEVAEEKRKFNSKYDACGRQFILELSHNVLGDYPTTELDVPEFTINLRPENLQRYARNAEEGLALEAITECKIISYSGEGGKRIAVDIVIRMTEEDATAFTGMPYITIRNMDIYPVILDWVLKGFKDGATTSVAVSRIANLITEESLAYAKTNEHNILLSEKGSLLYIPKECDNTQDYEDAFMQCCTVEGSDKFSLSNIGPSDRLLPKNLPVLVDWTNNKFAFSNSAGTLEVMDLSQCRPATSTHVINVFKRRYIGEKTVQRYMSYIPYTDLDPTKYIGKDKEFAQINASVNGGTGEIPTYYELLTEPAFATIAQMLLDLGESLERNPTKFERQFAISSLMDIKGTLVAIYKYFGSNTQKTIDEDGKTRSPALNQAVTPDWELPSIPLLNPNIKAMPHQKRVLNRMKDNPNFALLPVAAGGGKTPLAIMEVLYQYKNGKNAPYIILCPSMLVSQYVQEVSFFTNGRLNAIPITTSVVKREGLERLQKIFEAAPRNTVVVASYNALAYNAHNIAYGTRAIKRFPIVEFLRQFQFQFALCDESHQLKNASTTRSKGVRSLLADIPTIRLASGTMAYNVVTDLIGQASIMDPSIFGTTTDFEAEYGKWVRTPSGGVKMEGLRPGAEAAINRKLRQNLVIAGAERKEWAALLPEPKTSYHYVNLSPEEEQVYIGMIDKAVDQIKNSEAYKRSIRVIEEIRKEDPDSPLIEELEEKLSADIQPYLQKIERFLMDPSQETGLAFGEMPAKVQAVCDVIRNHNQMFADVVATPGQENTNKVIVFTENSRSAQAIFEYAEKDPSLKGTGLLYKASEKTEALNRFNKDSRIRWMVGVETSINTGLNLQAASRIVRAEYPWAPGAIEQGDARILRPNKKGKDTRKYVYFDWVICDGTIDTLKISRLMGKSVQVARFENPTDARYQDIGATTNEFGEPDTMVPVLSVSLDNIKKRMRFTNRDPNDTSYIGEGDLFPYFDAMRTLEKLRVQSFREYRRHHQDELNPDGTMVEHPFVVEKNPKDAKLLKNIPYVEGTNLYKADELGLQRLDDYLMQFAKDEEEYRRQFLNREDDEVTDSMDDEEADDTQLNAPSNSPMVMAITDLKDQTCWTEYGECKILKVSLNRNRVVVSPIGSAERIALTKDSVFVITKAETNAFEIQNKLLKSVGFKEYSNPEYVKPEGLKEIRRRGRQVDPEVLRKREEQRKLKEQEALTITLKPMLVNGVVALRYEYEKGKELAVNVLQDNKFSLVPKHWIAYLRNYKMIQELMELADSLGYRFKKGYDSMSAWQEIIKTMKKAGSKMPDSDTPFANRNKMSYRIITDFGIRNMLRNDMKITQDKSLLRLEPMFSNGSILAVMPDINAYPDGTRLRTKSVRQISGFRWERGPKAYDRYFNTIDAAISCVDKMRAAGLNVANYEDIVTAINNMIPRKFEDAKTVERKAPTRRTLTKEPVTKPTVRRRRSL